MLNDKEVLISIKKSVSKALAIKKALGQYVVAWDSEKKQVKHIETKDLPEYDKSGVLDEIPITIKSALIKVA
jgi:hypothetical protein